MINFVSATLRFSSRSRTWRALTAALLLAGPAAFAQAPANDDPCSAAPLTIGTTCTNTLATNVGATGTTSVADPNCSNYVDGDVWFSVVVPASGNLQLTTSAVAGSDVDDTGLAVYSGTCGSLTEVDCNDDGSSDYFSHLLLTNQTPGDVLLVRTFVYGNSTTGSYNICAQDVPPCAAPTNLAISNVGVTHATVSFTENPLSAGYQVTYTPAGGPAQTQTGNFSFDLTGLQPSTTYSVTVASSCGGTFTTPSAPVTFTTSPAPTNTTCANAAVLTAGTTCTATLTTNEANNASSSGADPSCANYNGGSSWFSVTVPASGNLRVSTSQADNSPVNNTGLAVYSGTCGSLTQLDCNNYGSGSSLSQLTLTGLTPGDVLLVRTWVYDNASFGEYNVCALAVPPCGAPTGLAISNVRASRASVSFTGNLLADDYQVTYTPTSGAAQTKTGSSPIDLTDLRPNTTYSVTVASSCGGGFTTPSAPVTFTTAPASANDECAGALALTVGTACTPVRSSNEYASRSLGVPDPSCADYNGDDTWFSVVVPASGILNLETGEVTNSQVYDTGLAVYGGTCGSLTPIACDDNNSFGNMSYVRLTGQTPGATLYLRVWSNGNYTHGAFTVCATTDDAAPVTEWLGGSHDWFAASNWSNGVPTATANAHVGQVPSGNYPRLTTAGTTAEVHSLVVDKYAGFKLTSGTLAVSGNLICRASNDNNFTSPDYDNNIITGGTIALRGTGPQQITGLSEIYDLTMDATGPATLMTEMRLDHQITMTRGVLSTGSNLIDMYSDNPFNEFTSTATISEVENGYILGQIRYRGFVNGTAPASFGGLGLILTSGGNAATPGSVRLNRFTGTAPAAVGSQAGITRYFVAEPFNDSGLNLTMQFQYFNHERNGIADASLGMYSAATPTGPWALNPGSTRQAPATPDAPSTITLSGLTHLSSWTLGSTAAPLPVELVSFTAEPAGAGALLRWATASEKNNAYFDVEASADGRTFESIGRVAGHGSTARASAYELRDASLARYASAQVYYRLRQVDADGRASFSPVRTVAAGTTAEASLTISAFPVPFAQTLTVRLRTTAAGPARLTLRDAWGRELLRQTADCSAGTQDVVMEKAGSLAPGFYLLTVEQDGRVLQQLKVSRE